LAVVIEIDSCPECEMGGLKRNENTMFLVCKNSCDEPLSANFNSEKGDLGSGISRYELLHCKIYETVGNR